MSKFMTRRSFLGSAAGAAVLAGLANVLAGCGDQGATTGGDSTAAADPGDTQYFKSDYEYTQEGEEKLSADQHELYANLVREGTVLLKNENAALPLTPADGKVMVFGNAAPQYIKAMDEAWKGAGFDFDDACWKFYSDGLENGHSNVTNVAVNENPWADVQAAGILDGASGVAVVTLGRRGREASDNEYGWRETGDYLALSAEEKDMLNGVAELRRSGAFSKMVVLFTLSNSPSWEDGPWSDAVDAVVWAGSYDDPYFAKHEREYSVDPLVEVLAGKANPSGRLADTIYKNNHFNPVMANFGWIDADLSHLSEGKGDEVQHEIDKWKPTNDKGSHWRRNYVYAEDIYVASRYYETRYEDKVLGQGNAGDFDYSAYVAYPFGYGLSYTTFDYQGLTVSEADDGFDVKVSVANTGSVEGKNAVTVYLQKPYTDYDRENGIEVASVQLAGYEKTDLIAPGASQDVTVHVKKSELATYDANKAKTYVLDAGDYYFTVANGTHEAINNILAAKGKTTADGMTAEGNADLAAVWTNQDFDDKTFSKSAGTGAEVTNLFDDVDPNKNATMKDLNSITWLTRSDWQGTFPTEPIHLVYTDEVAEMAKPIHYAAGSGDASSVPAHEFGKDSDLRVIDLRGKDYDDADWDKLLGEMTYEEMVGLVCENQDAIEKIGKPRTSNKDGSNGCAQVFAASGIQGIPYPMTAWRAATYNKGLNSQVGAMIGENELHAATPEDKPLGLYGFSCNIHRSPYSGRNYEYYSEDPFLSGTAIAAEVGAFVAKGGVTYMKHFAANDQESFRHGVPSWSGEQALREIYLKPFAMSMVDGKANGIMSGFNRLGMWWTGANPALIQKFAEGEQGYRGITLTDAFEADYMNTVEGLLNGTHAWLGGAGYVNTDALLLQDDYKSDPVMQNALWGAAHRILFVNANTLAMNGLYHGYQFGQSASDEPAKEVMVSGQSTKDHGESWMATHVTTDFYADGTFSLTFRVPAGGAHIDGTWEYSDDKGLTMTDGDGNDMGVEFADGVYTWDVEGAGLLGPDEGQGAISQYEFATAANAATGADYQVPEELTFTVTYSAGSDKVQGTDPAQATVKTGETFKLPECPYEGKFQTFDGWSVNGKVMQAGDEVTVAGYTNYDVVATWSDEVLVKASTQDTYKYSFIQDEGAYMILRCNGTVRLNACHQHSSNGTWEVSGSGSDATLTIKNEKGEPVSAKIEKDQITYSQDGFYSDWGQPNIGYGLAVLRTTYTHRIPVQDFLDAYNKTFGTSYTSLQVTEGSASFAEQEDETVPSMASLF